MRIETERITNLNEYEKIIEETRNEIKYLIRALDHEDKEASIHIAKRIDLKLHELEAYEFNIERRTITEHGHNGSQ